ncbi:MAG: 1-deoxy-D-xylulose-5-phosphate reductoisomerase [Gemmatimonadota bacterium]|nr:MAG: 1-deoxy-D-xylulose-5-phosphate reductoisomerase [Gemmatimonadota bacterium]
MIRVAILGATGSIGRSTLRVIGRHPDRFRVVGLAAGRSVDDLAALVAEHKPDIAVLSDAEALAARADLPPSEWGVGNDAVVALAGHPDVDVVVNAVVGAAGLASTIAALRSGKRLALANKESLVAGGPLVMAAADDGGGELIPIDSEHSAILQCLQGCDRETVWRIVLTASGGPFRLFRVNELATVTPAQALKHPTWDMGAKITIDSATLANKALEVIEAHFLYGLPYDRIDAVIHPQSIVHSFVELVDGSVLAQMGFPTMELPILYALTCPDRLADMELRTFDPVKASPLTFDEIDLARFRLFSLGVEAGRAGGTMPAVFNAANETAVTLFREGRIGFLEMGEVVDTAMSRHSVSPIAQVDDVLEADREARDVVRDMTGARRPAGGT